MLGGRGEDILPKWYSGGARSSGKDENLVQTEIINVGHITRDSEITGLDQAAGSNSNCMLHFCIKSQLTEAPCGKPLPRPATTKPQVGLMVQKAIEALITRLRICSWLIPFMEIDGLLNNDQG